MLAINHRGLLHRHNTIRDCCIARNRYQRAGQTEGGIVLTSETMERQQIGTVLGYVLKVGPQAYDGKRFSSGPWCEAGDWVLIGRYSGSRIQIQGGEIKLLNDDEIIATVPDPEAILHQF
jgi:co-chaperonin GroES (HSP10)